MKPKQGKTTNDWLNELVKKYQLPSDNRSKRILTETQLKAIKLKDER
jgi:hypothetical protein